MEISLTHVSVWSRLRLAETGLFSSVSQTLIGCVLTELLAERLVRVRGRRDRRV